jgi:hypothetical protein
LVTSRSTARGRDGCVEFAFLQFLSSVMPNEGNVVVIDHAIYYWTRMVNIG